MSVSCAAVQGLGGWNIRVDTSSCPTDAPVNCGTGLQLRCCPSGYTCAGSASTICCPTGTDCASSIYDAAICADPSWTLWKKPGMISSSNGAWCCESGYTGLYKSSGVLCLAGGSVPSGASVAVQATQTSTCSTTTSTSTSSKITSNTGTTTSTSSPAVGQTTSISTSTPTSTSSPSNSSSTSSSSHLGLILGVALGALAAILLILALIFLRRRRRRQNTHAPVPTTASELPWDPRSQPVGGYYRDDKKQGTTQTRTELYGDDARRELDGSGNGNSNGNDGRSHPSRAELE